MKKLLVLAGLFLFVQTGSFGQRATSVFAEFAFYGGSGQNDSKSNEGMGMGTFNVETRFKPRNDGFGMRIGFGVGTDGLIFSGTNYTLFPISVNYLAGKKRAFLEVDGGFMIILYKKDAATAIYHSQTITELSPNLTLGYRYQALKKGFTGRVFLGGAHFKGNNRGSVLMAFGGISLGYKFLGSGNEKSGSINR